MKIGIDMGGTTTKIGIVSTEGKILYQTSIPTPFYPDIDDFIDALYDATIPMIEKVGFENIESIGAGCPNGNFYKGTIEHAANLPWKGIVPFAEKISNKFSGIPCRLTNDANAAALGEMKYGVAQNMKNFIMITLGTGVGSGIVIDGKLVYGHDGFAGELGHVKIVRGTEGRRCGCGQTGCLETYCSATGVVRSFIELSWKNQNTNTITSKDIFLLAQKGDPTAIEVFRRTGELLGQAFADFVCFSAPEAIILFGGLARSGDLLIKPIQQSMEENLLPQWKGKIKILTSKLNESDAAIIGASEI
jgi:glucokinase